MSIDKIGRDLSVPIPPLDVGEWESMQIEGEAALIGAIPGDMKSAKGLIEELGKIVLSLSSEVMRLRLTYGEEVWTSVYHTAEEDAEIRKAHEATRKQ